MTLTNSLSAYGLTTSGSAITLSSNLRVTGDLIVQGDASAGENMVVAGDLEVDGTMSDTFANHMYLAGIIPDIGSGGDLYLIAPCTGEISKLWCVVEGDVGASGGTLTLSLSGSSKGTCDIADNAYAGDVFSGDMTDADVTLGDLVRIAVTNTTTLNVGCFVLLDCIKS